MSVSVLKAGRESLVFIGFSRNLTGQFRRQFAQRRARRLNPFRTAMHIAVHGGLDVRMSRDRLQGFGIRSCGLHYGEKGVPKDMQSRAVKVNGFSNALPSPVKGAFGHGSIPIPHNKKAILFWLQAGAQLLHRRDGTPPRRANFMEQNAHLPRGRPRHVRMLVEKALNAAYRNFL